MRRLLLLLFALLGAGAGAGVWADPPDVDQIGAGLKQRSDSVKQISDQLDAGDLSDATLATRLETLLGYKNDNQNDGQAITAALDEPSKRLDDLGPPPAEDQPPESDDIAKLRADLTDQISRLQGLSKQVELNDADIDRLVSRIRGLQGTRALSDSTKRTISPFAPRLWSSAAAEIPAALDGFVGKLRDWWRDQKARARSGVDLALLAAALVGAILLLLLPRTSHWHHFESTYESNPSPTTLAKRRRVAAISLSRGLLAAGAGGLLYGAAAAVGLVSQPETPFAWRIWLAFAFSLLTWNFARCLFSPRQPEWRLVKVGSGSAHSLRILLTAIFGLFVVDRVLAAGFAAAEAGIELKLAQAALSSSLFAVLLWLFLSPELWRSQDPPSASAAPSGSQSGSDATAPSTDAGSGTGADKSMPVWPRAICFAGRVLAVLFLVANALAYLKLSDFVFHRLVLLALFFILFWCVRVVARWGLSRLPFVQATATDAPPGDGESDEERLGFWLKLALDLNLLALAIPGFLLVVGFDWLDVRRWFEKLNTGIRIGGVTISFTSVLTAVAVFLLVKVVTRWASSVADKALLQRTRLDAGERNSIVTLVNYAGVVVGLLIALPIAGVSFSSLAIVAGALSVGIGFGLQSIVANFVSGLILLFERPIKIGDWIVVQSGEGYVKRIGARATEIQTFDRSSVLVPNTELVTSAVQNWFYRSQFGRLRVSVGVAYGSDPEQVRDILLGCAKKHAAISDRPEPTVRWVGFGDSSLEFVLRAYVQNIDDAYTIRSDLRFAIFKAFKEAGIEIPFPQRDLHIRSRDTPAGDSAVVDQDDKPGNVREDGVDGGKADNGGEGQ